MVMVVIFRDTRQRSGDELNEKSRKKLESGRYNL